MIQMGRDFIGIFIGAIFIGNLVVIDIWREWFSRYLQAKCDSEHLHDDKIGLI